MSIFYDGDFTVAMPQGARRWTYPFNGDNVSRYFEQDYMQRFDFFQPVPLNTGDVEFPSCYLVAESPLADLGGGIARWTRTYSQIPVSRVDQESWGYVAPGITPDPYIVLYVITGSSTVSSYTRITTGATHTFVVGDTVLINYSVSQASPPMVFFRYVTKQVRAVTSTTFDVDLISDISAPVYTTCWKSDRGRKPFTRVVPSQLHWDYYLPTISAGIATSDDIPVLSPTEIIAPNGDHVDSYSSVTTPTLATYRASVTAANWVVAEASVTKRWMGNIYERLTRYVKPL